MRAPEQPSGWPRAMAPPSTLTISGSRSGHSARQASDWAANASLSSTASRSPQPMPGPLERRARRPRPGRCRTRGARRRHAAGDDPGQRRRARPRRRRASSPSSSAAAPSLSGEELPAVTVPSGAEDRLQLGQRLERWCRAGCTRRGRARRRARAPPRRRTTPALPGRGGPPVAAQRERVLRLAADPVALGQDLGALAERDRPLGRASPGLTIRQPSVRRVQRLVPARVAARPAWAAPTGARLIDSTPPASTSDASPTAIARGWRAIDRLQAGAAQPVDGRAGHASSAARPAAPPSGRRRGCPRRRRWRRRRSTSSIAAGSSSGARSTSARTDVRGEVVGADAGQRAAVAADRRAHGVEDEDLAHGHRHGRRPCVAARSSRSARSSSAVGGSVVVQVGGDRAAPSRSRRAPGRA